MADIRIRVGTAEKGKHPRYCVTYRGEPIRWGVCNTGWLEAVRRAGPAFSRSAAYLGLMASADGYVHR